jgi:hypothetical protein
MPNAFDAHLMAALFPEGVAGTKRADHYFDAIESMSWQASNALVQINWNVRRARGRDRPVILDAIQDMRRHLATIEQSAAQARQELDGLERLP